MATNSSQLTVVCFSSQDWDAQLPTNRQQVMRRVARRGHQVLFVETSGFLGAQLWRLVRGPNRRSLLARLFATETAGDRVRVRRMLNFVPWRTRFHASAVANVKINWLWLRLLPRRGGGSLVVWSYDPLAYAVFGALPGALGVFDCVDDYAEQVGGDATKRRIVKRAEELAGRNADLVFTTTEPLYERHRRWNGRTFLVPNAGDFDHFHAAADLNGGGMSVGEAPVVGFAGNFLTSKVDFDLLESLARDRPGWSLVLIGPASGEPRRRLESLLEMSNVRWLGPKAYEDLPRYVAAFDVGLIPYRSTAYTRACFPLKLYEYLAAGKPVVASGLPALTEMQPHVTVAETHAEFVGAVQTALGTDAEAPRKERFALAARNSWEAKTERLLELIGAELRG
jgi:glycosyltransferase involved in cell wall biosynthesis